MQAFATVWPAGLDTLLNTTMLNTTIASAY
jgi:hypothetical protein